MNCHISVFRHKPLLILGFPGKVFPSVKIREVLLCLAEMPRAAAQFGGGGGLSVGAWMNTAIAWLCACPEQIPQDSFLTCEAASAAGVLKSRNLRKRKLRTLFRGARSGVACKKRVSFFDEQSG